MSLEIALAENTAALRELLAHLKSGTTLKQPTPEEVDANIKELNKAPKTQAAKGKNTSAGTTANAAPTPPTAEAGEGAAPAKTAEESVQSSAASAEAEPQASTAAAETPPDYATTAKAVTDLVKAKGRDAAVAVLAEFGAANLKEVQPEQFAAVIAACAEASQ